MNDFKVCKEMDVNKDVNDVQGDLEHRVEYDQHSWPFIDPTGFSFKGQKPSFQKAVESLKDILQRGTKKVVNDITFTVLDARQKGRGIEFEVEIIKGKERGMAGLKIFGPNARKECTVMINKVKKQDVKFAEMLAADVIKNLIDNEDIIHSKDKNDQDFNDKNLSICNACNKVFSFENDLKVHMESLHKVVSKFSCTKCSYRSGIENDLAIHLADTHRDKSEGVDEEMDVDNKEDEKPNENLKRTRSDSVPNTPCSSPPNKRKQVLNLNGEIHINLVEDAPEVNSSDTKISGTDLTTKVLQLEDLIDNQRKIHENYVNELTAKNYTLENENSQLRTTVVRLKKDISNTKGELKELKVENTKINQEIGKLQWNNDKNEALVKSADKTRKIKENLPLFNKIIEKQVKDGDIINVDIAKYLNAEMEECDGGEISSKTTGYGQLENLMKNKERGGKRTSPQENPESRIDNAQQFQKMQKCPQCDFVSQNEIFFNKHMVTVHSGQPNCPFCFSAFEDYSALRKHCEAAHKEINCHNVKSDKRRPCRYFKNGTGHCKPRSGTCQYDHTIIPENERELCFHKEACSYKPNCIFFHPEGQDDDLWEQNKRKTARICRFAENGQICMRAYCNFYHPSVRNSSGFHWNQPTKPPQILRRETEKPTVQMRETVIPTLPMRIPVIVRRKENVKSKIQELNQSLVGMALN